MVDRVTLDKSKLPKRKTPAAFRNPNGRPVGSKNRTTKIVENLLKMKKDGELPHEFLLRVVRGEKIKQGPPDQYGVAQYVYPELSERIECAKAAAPYFAPRLSTIEVVKNLTDDNLDLIIQQAAEQSGVLVDFNKMINEDGSVVYEPVESETGDDDNDN